MISTSKVLRYLALPLFMFLGAQGAEFCWKDTVLRDVGTIPNKCAEGYDRIGLLCYKKCPTGYTRFGFDCHQTCPDGMRNDGLYCRNAEYGRGAGFTGWTVSAMYKRCEAAHGAGNCEKHRLIVYPKCKPGYSSFGCCICRPKKPDCKALGMGHQLGLSCAKKMIIGAPTVGQCDEDKEMNGGLCYNKCPPNYNGVAMVCWAKTPPGWVNCGMGAAKDKTTCDWVIVGQVSSVVMSALNFLSVGMTSSLSPTYLKAAAEVGNVKKLRDSYAAIKSTKTGATAINSWKLTMKGKRGYEALEYGFEGLMTNEDAIRYSALLVSLVDPTGTAAVVAAYTRPKCSAIYSNYHTQSTTTILSQNNII
jgi:hypothetical protein